MQVQHTWLPIRDGADICDLLGWAARYAEVTISQASVLQRCPISLEKIGMYVLQPHLSWAVNHVNVYEGLKHFDGQ